MYRTKLAFLVAPLIASAVYWWITYVEHIHRVGVTPSTPAGFFLLVLVFAYAGTFVAALPAYLLLRAIGLAKNLPILAIGTCLGWLFISYSDDGRPLLHPEGFAVGLIAACVFVLVRSGVLEEHFRKD